MIRKPTILMWTFLVMCGILGAGQAWLRLLSVWMLMLVCWLERPQIKTTKSINILIGVATSWWLLLLFPLPLSFHSFLIPEIASIRNPIATFVQLHNIPLAIDPSIHMVDGVSLMLFTWILLSSRTLDVQHWINFLCITGISLVWIGWIHKFLHAEQIFGLLPIPTEMRSPYFAPFINGNHAGYLFCALIPCAVRFQSRLTIRVLFLFHFLLAISMTESRGAIGLGLLMLLLELPIPSFVLTLTAILMASIVWYTAPSLHAITHGRIELWQDAISALYMAMPFGTGFGGFSDIYSIVKSTPQYSHSSHAHQEYLEWFISTGILGLLLPLMGLVMWLKRLPNTLTENHTPFKRILLVFALAGFVDFPLQLNALLLMSTIALKILLQDRAVIMEGTVYGHRMLLLPSTLGMITTILWLTNTPFGMPLTSDPVDIQVRKEILNETKVTQFLMVHIEADPTAPGLDNLVKLHATHHPTNIETQKTLARWYQSTDQFEDSCKVWNGIWSLETPILSDKLDLVPEALACDNNLWNAVIALPDDVEILVRAYQTLLAQNLEDAALFCLQRAHDIKNTSPLGSLHFIQWLIESEDWKRAWLEHNSLRLRAETSKSQQCLYLKNAAKLGFHFSLDQNPEQFKTLLNTCGQASHWKRRLVMAELKMGNKSAIKTATDWIQTNPKDILNLWKFLAHAEQVNGDTNAACQWVQLAFHNNPNRIPTDMIQRCAQHEPPFKKEIWKIQSKNDINKSIQTSIGPNPL